MPPKGSGVVKKVVDRVKAAWNALRGRKPKKTMQGSKKKGGKKKMGGGGGGH